MHRDANCSVSLRLLLLTLFGRSWLVLSAATFLFFLELDQFLATGSWINKNIIGAGARHSEELSPKTGRNSPWPPTQERPILQRRISHAKDWALSLPTHDSALLASPRTTDHFIALNLSMPAFSRTQSWIDGTCRKHAHGLHFTRGGLNYPCPWWYDAPVRVWCVRAVPMRQKVKDTKSTTLTPHGRDRTACVHFCAEC